MEGSTVAPAWSAAVPYCFCVHTHTPLLYTTKTNSRDESLGAKKALIQQMMIVDSVKKKSFFLCHSFGIIRVFKPHNWNTFLHSALCFLRPRCQKEMLASYVSANVTYVHFVCIISTLLQYVTHNVHEDELTLSRQGRVTASWGSYWERPLFVLLFQHL